MPIDAKALIRIEELLEDIQAACSDFGMNSLSKTLESIGNYTKQSQYLDVAVLGQFKSGKSSFINAYLSKSILPVGDIPVTSVITRIHYAEQEKAAVTFLNGSSKDIPLDAIAEYVSESSNPNNIKQVKILDVATPILQNIKNLRLVDTPGIGSIWQHNTETTADWLPEVGGVLFITSAEKPISSVEMSLLQEIYMYSPEIGVVITKCDLFSEDHLKQIERFTSDALRHTFGKDFSIHRYSAYKDTERYNKEFEENFFHPLALDRDSKYTAILVHKINSLANACLSYLRIAHRASLQKETERQKIRSAILDEHLNSSLIRRELVLIVGSYKEKTRDNVNEYLSSFRADIEAHLRQDFEKASIGWKGNLYHLTRQYENWLKQSLGQELNEVLLKEEKSYEILDAVRKHLSFYLKSFRERLNNNLEQVLGIKVELERLEITVGELKKPDISISRTFDSHIDLLWFLIPMRVFRKAVCSYFSKQLGYEIEKNIYRLTSGLTERIFKEMDHLFKQTLSYINEELNTIERLLAENESDSDTISARAAKIEMNMQKLNAAESELE